MSNLRAKLKKENGFTLIEMLIVVAIIAILIAIAIPMVNKALERAREATDSANERAALGLAMVEVMTENKLPSADGKVGYYKIGKTGTSNASSEGTIVGAKADDDTFKYGKGTVAGDIAEDHTDKAIKIAYDPDVTGNDSQFTVTWE